MSGSNKCIHTVWHDPQWANVREGEKKPLSTHETKQEAVAAGRRMALSERVEHLIHNQDHSIHERNSYGNDRADRAG